MSSLVPSLKWHWSFSLSLPALPSYPLLHSPSFFFPVHFHYRREESFSGSQAREWILQNLRRCCFSIQPSVIYKSSDDIYITFSTTRVQWKHRENAPRSWPIIHSAFLFAHFIGDHGRNHQLLIIIHQLGLDDDFIFCWSAFSFLFPCSTRARGESDTLRIERKSYAHTNFLGWWLGEGEMYYKAV